MRKETTKNKNSELLGDFASYCAQNPEQRFWQALCNWADVSFVLIQKKSDNKTTDTFYFENKLS